MYNTTFCHNSVIIGMLNYHYLLGGNLLSAVQDFFSQVDIWDQSYLLVHIHIGLPLWVRNTPWKKEDLGSIPGTDTHILTQMTTLNAVPCHWVLSSVADKDKLSFSWGNVSHYYLDCDWSVEIGQIVLCVL